MSGGTRLIVAVENGLLRRGLLAALATLRHPVETMRPDDLLDAELPGHCFIYLETSDDAERMIAIAQALWDRCGTDTPPSVHFISYSSPAATPDSVVFRLWHIGPEGTVVVQIWTPEGVGQNLQETVAFTERVLHR